MKKIKYFLPALIWMIFIFIESAMPGDVSSHQSHFIVDFIYSLLSIPSHYQNMISFIVRKCAHMSEYFILTLFASKTLQIIFIYEIICSELLNEHPESFPVRS